MTRIVRFVTFLAVATAILVGVHYYLWARFIRDTALPGPYSHVFTVLLILLGISLPLGLALTRSAHNELSKVFLWGTYIWMGLLFLLFVAAGAGDLVRLLISGGHNLALGPLDPERRLWIMRVVGGSSAGLAVASGVLGIHQARTTPRVRKVSVPLTRLPRGMNGTTIVQLSDIHVGPTIDGDWLRDVVARVNEMSPDVVAITGDLVDGGVPELRDGVAPLADLKAKYGVYFVTGNHEYYSGADAWIAELTRLGIRVLRNERVTIGEGVNTYELAGVDDATAHRFGNGHGADLSRALQGYKEKDELVLLAHQPLAIFEACQKNVGLQLSGHTHGGQIWPWNFLVRLQQPYVEGLAKHNNTYIYVSRGTGYWGPPMRVGAPAEITRIELVSVEQKNV